jgi:ribose/xylose/arabinose/galactoside ABC-type transport system permease subunit
VAIGLVLPVVTAVVAVAGFREQFIVGGAAVQFGAMMFLWVAIVIGVTLAVIVARRSLPGIIVGLVSVVLVQGVMVLSQSAGESIAVEDLTNAWFVSLLMAGLPWAIGMAFGWTATHRRRTVYDGAPRPLR